MYSEEEQNLIILSSFEKLTYQMKKNLLCDFDSSRPDFAKAEKSLIKTSADGVYNKVEKLFHSPAYRKKVLDEFEEKGITCVTLFSENYPAALKEITTPPVVLYCKGDTSLLKSKCFTVVGSRRTNPKAISDCKRISGELSKFFTIVSGNADGADSSALRGALDEGGKVISVLASGFDCIYPSSCEPILKEVEKSGLIVSEYLPHVQAKPYNFPVRNRILAGLSIGTLVVSAGEKSGALITAEYATEYGRDVFAFPYSIGTSMGAGCNSLIKKGAYLTENTLDILKIYGLDFIETDRNEVLTGEELEVYEAIKKLGEGFLPDVAKAVGKLPHEVIPIICALQIKSRVVSLGGNRYSAV